ncbi:DarT ssDNA thymidine ADP-ribosyltransferase family protein [Lactobacillus sp. AN1001]
MFNEIKYSSIFDRLKNTDTPKSWYTTKSLNKEVKGIMWHFTDINNVVNILSSLKVMSKNQAVNEKKMLNDNASEVVNNTYTHAWVHDYARFYLRPKTPTQYRNEGIYPLSAINHQEKFWRLFGKDNQLWTESPVAHLPIPVFIGFELKTALQRGDNMK